MKGNSSNRVRWTINTPGSIFHKGALQCPRGCHVPEGKRVHTDRDHFRIKAATAGVSEAQARINLAFAQYLLNHGECKDIAALLMTPLGDGKGDGSLYIGDDDAHFEDKTAGKVGGWIFWVDESKKLETVNEDTRVGLLEDPDGNKIDMSETGLYLRIPQCNSSNKDEK
mgnify:CR=1 FL=1